MSEAVRPSLLVRLGIALALTTTALAIGPSAAAVKPDKVEFPVDFRYEIEGLSEGCGFEVWFSMVGAFKGTIFKDRHGEIRGEFDSQPNTTVTFSAPENERSFSFKFSTTFHNEFPEGVDPGDLVVASATGFLEKLPGLPAHAGRLVFPDGEVLFVEDGIPYVDYGVPTVERGNQYGPDADPDAAICGYLAGD